VYYDLTSVCGLLMLELYHRNPVLIVFCEELHLLSNQTNNITHVSLDQPTEQLGYQRSISDSMMTLKHSQICNRWCKAYALINTCHFPNNNPLEKSCNESSNLDLYLLFTTTNELYLLHVSFLLTLNDGIVSSESSVDSVL
jgi:hypothetical protein